MILATDGIYKKTRQKLETDITNYGYSKQNESQDDRKMQPHKNAL
jgi:hypothetical protein